MATSAMNHSQSGGCVLWTPWGPQAATEQKPRLSTFGRNLRQLAAASAAKAARENMSGVPECASEPK